MYIGLFALACTWHENALVKGLKGAAVGERDLEDTVLLDFRASAKKI